MFTHTKETLIRELANRANFTIGDMKIIMDEFEQLFKEIVVNQDCIAWRGLFNLTYGEIAAYEGFNPYRGEKMSVPAQKKALITISTSLHRAMNGFETRPRYNPRIKPRKKIQEEEMDE